MSRERMTSPLDGQILRKMHLSLVRDALESLILAEKEKLRGEDETLTNNRKTLFAYYKESKFFRRVYQEAISFLYLPRTDPELEDHRKRFAGRIFHDLAQIFIRAKLPSSSILLSPGRTLEAYEQLYPQNLRMTDSFGLDSLKGISVPDGLIVKEVDGRVQITTICEYTLWGNQQNLVRRKSRVGMEKKRFPELFAEDAYLLFVVPKEAGLLRLRGFSCFIQFQEVPFTHEQFRDFMDGLYRFYRLNSDSATLAEIQTRARQQRERGEEYRKDDNPLTPEYSKHLARGAK